MKNKLPNFLIVGAAKSGTSSLHYYLNQHADIFMPTYFKSVKVKEPRFFVKKSIKNRVKHIDNYENYKALFANSEKYKSVGEASVFYLYFYDEAIQNIKKYLGERTKIIIILRNPIDRALSAYNHVNRTKIEKLSFDEAVIGEKKRYESNPKITPMIMYKEMGLYYKMVKAYINSFDQVKVIFFDDLKKNPEKTTKECFVFLNVNSNVKVNLNKKLNVGGKKWKNKFVKNIYNSKGALLNPLKRLVPFNKRKKLNIWFRNKYMIENKHIKKETREYLEDYFKKDINKLSLLLKKDLTAWTK